ncbi:17733_t:CDS:2, partial [Racocetra persica]
FHDILSHLALDCYMIIILLDGGNDIDPTAEEIEYHQFFLELFDKDPTLPNSLSYKQYHRLYSVLIAIEPSLADPLLDAHSALRGVINKQGNEYKYYKEAQKKIEKDVQWYEFLKLDKKQYLNFRFLRGISLFHKSKEKAEEVLKEHNHSNADETYDNTHDSFNNNGECVNSDNDDTDKNAPEPDNLTTTDHSQDNTTTTDPIF